MGRYRKQITATIFMILHSFKILVGTKDVGWFCGKRKLSFWLLLGEMHVPCWHGNAFSNWESSKMLPSPTLNSNTWYYIILRLNHTVYILNLPQKIPFIFCKFIPYPNLKILVQDNIIRINCVSALIHCNSMLVERQFF